MEILLFIFFIIILVLQYRIKHTIFHSNFLIMGPYVVIILFNNLIMKRFGFYVIKKEIIVITIIGMICFSIGSVISYPAIKKLSINSRFSFPNIKLLSFYTLAVVGLRILQLLGKFLIYGLEYMKRNDFEALLERGLTGHLMITLFPIAAILFYRWLTNKKKFFSLFLVLVILALNFATLVKANIIASFIVIFVYCSIKDSKYFFKGGIILVTLVTCIFAVNYMTKFLFEGIYNAVPKTYYIDRLWTYIAGGTINFNLTIDDVKSTYNFADYYFQTLMAFPNMILNRLLGFTVGIEGYIPYIENFPAVMARGETSNVLSTMGFMYGNGNLLSFVLMHLGWGGLSEAILEYSKKSKNECFKLFSAVYITYCILSFFGLYFSIASVWEKQFVCFFLFIFFIPWKKGNLKSINLVGKS